MLSQHTMKKNIDNHLTVYILCIHNIYSNNSMDAQLILSQKDGRPMYRQIMEQIKRLIAQGDWPQGEKVPSIRELAVATQVSVITVKRAYQELERAGVIITRHGVGSFVTGQEDLGDQIMQDEIDQHLLKAIQQAKNYGVSVESLLERIKTLSEQPAGDDHE